MVGCWCQLPQASSYISVKMNHTASGLCCMINTSHWRMVFSKPCNCLHRMCSQSACFVSAYLCGYWVYCLFIRILGLQVMTSLLQCSSVWSVCASLIWYLFHVVVIYTQVFLQPLAQLVFYYCNVFWLKTAAIFRELQILKMCSTCSAGCQLELVKYLYMLLSFISTVLWRLHKM